MNVITPSNRRDGGARDQAATITRTVRSTIYVVSRPQSSTRRAKYACVMVSAKKRGFRGGEIVAVGREMEGKDETIEGGMVEQLDSLTGGSSEVDSRVSGMVDTVLLLL